MTFALFFLSLVLDAPQNGRYQVRAECSESSPIQAQVLKNAPLKVQFAIAPTCYAVTGVVDGKTVSGYILQAGLDSVEEFDRAHKENRVAAFKLPLVEDPKPEAPAVATPPPAPKTAEAAEKAEAKKTVATAPVPPTKRLRTDDDDVHDVRKTQID